MRERGRRDLEDAKGKVLKDVAVEVITPAKVEAVVEVETSEGAVSAP